MKFSNTISAAVLTGILVLPGSAQNKLTVHRNGMNSVEIVLENTQRVAGMQFRIVGTADLELSLPERAGRTGNAGWMLATSRPNDSTIAAVLINTTLSELESGSGPILRISFSSVDDQSQLRSRVSIINALIANAQAESLGVVVQNLEFSAGSSIEPPSFAFGRNFPNPFNPSTNLGYKLNKAAHVRLTVYDVAGREISRLVDENQNAGDFSLHWEGKDNAGRPVSSGVYFAVLSVDKSVATQKLILAR